MSEVTLEKDEFELKLEQNAEILKNCQAQKGLASCFNCDLIFECETRKNYVDAAYNSMSKGSSGGFEF